MNNVTNYEMAQEFQDKLIGKLPKEPTAFMNSWFSSQDLDRAAEMVREVEKFLKGVKGGQALQARLIAEELAEFLEAKTLVDQVDAQIDIAYVNYGGLARLGIDADPLFKIVHDANMTKLFPDGKAHYDEQGKLMKPPTFVRPEPELHKAIERQQFHGTLAALSTGDTVEITKVLVEVDSYLIGRRFVVRKIKENGNIIVSDGDFGTIEIPRYCYKAHYAEQSVEINGTIEIIKFLPDEKKGECFFGRRFEVKSIDSDGNVMVDNHRGFLRKIPKECYKFV